MAASGRVILLSRFAVADGVLRYHTAEYAEVSTAGLVVAHIGHGTDRLGGG